MKANPFDSCVSGLRMTLIASATRFSEDSHDLISSAVTQTGRFPRKTVKLISVFSLLRDGSTRRTSGHVHIPEASSMLAQAFQNGKQQINRKPFAGQALGLL